MELLDECACGLRRANGVCPKCDELIWDLIEEELQEGEGADDEE